MAEEKNEMTLEERSRKAALRFLEMRNYEIIDQDYTCPYGKADIIAWDDDNLVFVEVGVRTEAERGLPDENYDKDARKEREMIAASYLRDFDKGEATVRFDALSMLVLRPDRALLRHSINVLGAAC